MAHTSSIEYDAAARETLLGVARQSIHAGVMTGKPLTIDPDGYPPLLAEHRACFVTLHMAPEHRLRGCVGSLRARGPLVSEIARTANAAAFRDPRFPPVTEGELGELQIHISVLTAPTPISFTSEADLLSKLRPHLDGLILRDGRAMGTFLPEVWKTFPEPAAFLVQLRLKANLSAAHWSSTLEVERYTTESFS